MYKDKTLQDNNRTELNLQRSEIQKVLPEFYSEDYPQLITLFEKYYDWLNDSDNPGGQIKNLYLSRDATQVPERLLPFLEDELLLGQAYFGGFINKREAIKRSNLLYRSKGTKYSIEQFFRAFYGIDPQVVYPKENIFKVGPQIDYELANTNSAGQQIKEEASKIGPESRKFITDDKLYQVLSILIRAEISITEWLDVYKLFVHPAGVYLGAEIVIEAINKSHDGVEHTPGLYNNGGLNIIQDDVGLPIPEFLTITGVAELDIEAVFNATLLSGGDGNTPVFRQDVNTLYSNIGSDVTIEQFGEYTSYRELLSPNSPTFDDSDGILMSQDSDGTRSSIIIETFDTHKFSTVFDSA
jgi:hypothetical protein